MQTHEQYGSSARGECDPLVSVIIASYNRNSELCNLLRCLLAQSYSLFEIIVVDQAKVHDEATEKFLYEVQQTGRVKILRQEKPSTTLARNTGLACARGDIFVFCDDDVLVEPDFLQSHVDVYADPTIGGIAGRIIEINRPLDLGESGMPPGRIRPDGFCTMGFGQNQRADVEVAMGGNMSFRRAVVESIGGFDTNYTGTAFREEFDFAYRAFKAGFSLVYEPGISVVHLDAPTGGANRPHADALVDRFAGDTLFFLKHLPHRSFPRFLSARWRWFVFPGTIRFAITHRRPLSLFAPYIGVLIGVSRYIRREPAFRPDQSRSAELTWSR